jgi:hypothetical protein
MTIEWKPLIYENIPEGIFEISSTGEIRVVHDDASVKIYVFECGRVTANLYYNNKTYTEALSRLVAMTFIPTPFGIEHRRFLIHFKDGNRHNVCASNLEWTSPGGRTNRTYAERKQLLDFIYNHKDLNIKECAAKYKEETGNTVTEQTIRMIYNGHIQNLDMFGYTIDDFIPKFKSLKLPYDVVCKICKVIVKYNGNARAIHKETARLFPDISQDAIDRIRLKVSYANISDNYFEYYGRGQFYPVNK